MNESDSFYVINLRVDPLPIMHKKWNHKGPPYFIKYDIQFIRTIMMTLSIAIFVCISGCQKSLIKDVSSFKAQSTWYWGGDSGRRGLSPEEIRPPLQLAWIYKANGAVGEAIAIADSFIFFGTQSGEISVLPLRTGKSARTLKIQKKVNVTCLVDGHRLIVVQRWRTPSLRSLDISTGEVLWTNDLGPIVGEPLLTGIQLFGGNEWGIVFTVNSGNGEVIWETDLGKPVRGSIARSGETLACVTDGGMVWALSSLSGNVIWKRQLLGSISATPVLTENRLFIGTTDGVFYGLSLSDGSVEWQRKVRGSVYQTAASDEETVYFGTTQGVLYCLDSRDGSEIWHFDSESVIGTSPLISGRWIYFGTLDRFLYALERKTGLETWRFRTRGRIRSSPVVWKGMLILASEERFVYGFIEKT